MASNCEDIVITVHKKLHVCVSEKFEASNLNGFQMF